MERVLTQLDQILGKQDSSNTILIYTNHYFKAYERKWSISVDSGDSALSVIVSVVLSTSLIILLMVDLGKSFQDANFLMKFISENSLSVEHIQAHNCILLDFNMIYLQYGLKHRVATSPKENDMLAYHISSKKCRASNKRCVLISVTLFGIHIEVRPFL